VRLKALGPAGRAGNRARSDALLPRRADDFADAAADVTLVVRAALELLRAAPERRREVHNARPRVSEPAAGEAAPFGRVDLGELARQAVADAVPQAAARGTALALDAAPGVAVSGDRAALAALARNLIDNAVRYSPAGSRIEVGVGRDGDHVRLRVDDPGPGIPPADRERVFDRFYRRSAGDQDGTGLGLAIVRSVADRHGAELNLEEAPAGGLRVTVRFTAAPPESTAAASSAAVTPASSTAVSAT